MARDMGKLELNYSNIGTYISILMFTILNFTALSGLVLDSSW